MRTPLEILLDHRVGVVNIVLNGYWCFVPSRTTPEEILRIAHPTRGNWSDLDLWREEHQEDDTPITGIHEFQNYERYYTATKAMTERLRNMQDNAVV